jgi:hypothetical protein
LGDLYHFVDGFGRDEEKNLSRRGNKDSLLENVVGLALEGKLWKMVNLRKKVKG